LDAYVNGSLSEESDANAVPTEKNGPLVWNTEEMGDLDLDVLVMDQLNTDPSMPPYVSSRVLVRRVHYAASKDNKEFIDSCNKVGRHHVPSTANCWKNLFDQGKMFGVGMHVYNGVVQKFKTNIPDEEVWKMKEQARQVLGPLFPHQVITMCALEESLGVSIQSPMPQAFNV
jgi:hypothetical protein